MSRIEAVHVAGFLSELSDRFGTDGCNDLFLEDTPENRQLVADAERSQMGEDAREEVSADGGLIGTFNGVLLDHLLEKFMKEHGLKEEDLP